MKKNLLTFLLLFSVFIFAKGQSSGAGQYGQNNVFTLQDALWYVKSYDRTDVFYYHNKDQADITLRLSIKAQQELSRFFDYSPVTRIQIRLYKDALDFRDLPLAADNQLIPHPYEPDHAFAENDAGMYSPYHGGLPIFVVPVYFSSSYESFYKQLKYELARFYLREMLYSAYRGSRVSRVNFRLPSWYEQGLPAFLAEGLTPEEVALLRTLTPDQAYNFMFADSYSPTQRAVQKSFWAFMTRSQSFKKISEIVYMTRLNRSAEGGFTSVLGMSSATMFAQWHDSFEKEFFNAQGIDLASGAKALPLTQGKERLVSVARHPKLPLVAYITEQKSDFKLWQYDIKKNKRTELATVTSFTDYKHFRDLVLPIAYSPNGNTLMACMPYDNQWMIYNYTNRKLSYLPLEGQLDMVNSLQFSPDGKNVVLSAVKDGSNDLFLLPLAKNSFTQITFDTFDDLYPIFNSDTTIIFSSNRDTVLVPKSKANLNALENGLDLYEYKIKKKTITRLTKTPYLSEKATRSTGKQLLYYDDQTGVPNLNVQADTTQRIITSFKQGLIDLQMHGKGVMLTSFQNGQPAVFLGDTLDWKSNYPAGMNPYVEARKSVWLEQEAERKRKLQKDELGNNPPIQTQESEKIDTIIQQPRRNSRYYVFDDETDTVGRRAPKKVIIYRRKNTFTRKPVEPEETALDINKLKITMTNPYKKSYYYHSVRGYVESDPAFGLNGVGKLTLEDPFAKERLTMGLRLFLNLKNGDFFARYQWFAKRLQWEVGGRYMIRSFDDPQSFSYQNIEFYGAGSIPLDRYNRISVRPFASFSTRYDVRLNDLINLDGNATVYGADLNYTFDKTKAKGGTTLGGMKVFGQVRIGKSLQTPARQLTEVYLDARKYHSFFNSKFILALRFSAGAFLGETKYNYYFGGYNGGVGIDVDAPASLNIQGNAEHFYFSRWITSVRGYNLNARTGTQFGLVNAELRMPLAVLFNKAQTAKNPYNAIWTVFYDLGTAWTTGNPFSQRNPIDATTIYAPPYTITVQSLKSPFLMGVGTGLRILILGHSVRGEVAWSIEDNAIGKTKFVLSLSREF